MKNILVIGSLNMDFVFDVQNAPRPGETIQARSMTQIPGGKGANQAYAAGKLGGNVAMLGAVGADSAGDRLLESLSSVGVNVERIIRSEDVGTGLASIYVDEKGENQIVIAAGANACVDVDYIRRNDDMIQWCDILMMQLEISLEAVEYAAMRAKELGKMVILDPAPARSDLPDALLKSLYLIKPNENEILVTQNLVDVPVEDAAKGLLEKGVENVMVTIGAEGSILYRKGESPVKVPARSVKAVDTTAAGDCFAAALAVAMSKDEALPDAAHYASKAAAISVTRKGAQPSIPAPEEIN